MFDLRIVGARVIDVLVNGRLVVKDGEHTGSLPGRVLRRA